MSSIWICEKDKKVLVRKIQAQNEEDPLFDGGKIEELYIDKETGAIHGGEEIGKVFVRIDIPFEVWIGQFLRFNSFDTMLSIIEERDEDIKKIKEKLEKLKSRLDKI